LHSHIYLYRQAELLEIYAKTARKVNNSVLYKKVIAFTVTKKKKTLPAVLRNKFCILMAWLYVTRPEGSGAVGQHGFISRANVNRGAIYPLPFATNFPATTEEENCAFKKTTT
jgi:hypothetical protein